MATQNNNAISVNEEERQETVPLATILGIPDDIIVNILERLPIRSLLQLKPVSEIWQDLFSYPIRPGTCYSYLSRISYLIGFIIEDSPFAIRCMPTLSVLEVEDKLQTVDFKSFSFLPRNFDREIIGSSNGFLLYSRTTIEKTRYVITNPFTKQIVILPYTHEPGSVERCVCFVCEQDYTLCLTRYTVMFLYDAIDGVNVKIFNSKDHPNSVESFIQLGPNSRRRKAVGAINNIFYWFMLDSLSIIAIDVNGILVGETDFHFLSSAKETCWYIFEGCMYCAFIYGHFDTLELWVSRAIPGVASEEDFDWESRYGTRTRRFSPKLSVCDLIGFDPRDPKTIFFTTYGESDDLKSYNFQTKKVQIYDGNARGCFCGFPCEWFPWPLPLQLNV